MTKSTYRLHQRFNRFRGKSRDRFIRSKNRLPQDTQEHPSHASSSTDSTSRDHASSANANNASEQPIESTNMVNVGALLRDDTERHSSSDRSTYGSSTGHGSARSDIWSAACREAVESLRAELDITLLEGKHVKQMLENIDNIEKEQTQQSAFLRGVKCLRAAKVPLKRFKLALDLASPVASLEPIASAVLGVVRVVTVLRSALQIPTRSLQSKSEIC